jgi:hypothetical protein
MWDSGYKAERRYIDDAESASPAHPHRAPWTIGERSYGISFCTAIGDLTSVLRVVI